jgi:ElaB/YqjD/DUF883 family membrane-anchored ribosome-binding protein
LRAHSPAGTCPPAKAGFDPGNSLKTDPKAPPAIQFDGAKVAALAAMRPRAPGLKRRESFNTRSRSDDMSTLRDTKQAVEDVGAEVADAARGSADAARTEFSRLGAKLRANGARLEEDLAEARERLGAGAKQFGDAAAEQIREHPLAAFGIAFAAGVLVSRLLRSR